MEINSRGADHNPLLHLAIAWHELLIQEFGGAPGLQDFGLPESALDRPNNLLADKPDATLEELAALYGVGVTKAHALIAGNKRIAFALMVAFLEVHGQMLDAT